MSIKPLIATKSIAVIPGNASAGLRGFEQVASTPEFKKLFQEFFALSKDCLYNQSPIYPFAYLNKGAYKLFVNESWRNTRQRKMIPIVQHNFTEPSYSLYQPMASLADIEEVNDQLSRISKDPVEIIDCTGEYADWMQNASNNTWKKEKTSDDVIQDAQIITSLPGRNFSSIRNTLRRVERDLKPNICRLDKYTMRDAQRVFEDWKELQGKKYFRVTVGRDLRLIEECAEWVDECDFFGYVYYVDGYPSAANFGCRSWNSPEWGIDVTCKARVDCRGLSDFAYHHLVTQMYRQKIRWINDCGFAGAGDKISKGKWQPQKFIPNFKLVRTAKSV